MEGEDAGRGDAACWLWPEIGRTAGFLACGTVLNGRDNLRLEAGEYIGRRWRSKLFSEGTVVGDWYETTRASYTIEKLRQRS